MVVEPPDKALKIKNEGRPKRMAWVLEKGNAWNPLLQYPRNKSCFCGSGNKFKKCCILLIAHTVSEEFAKDIQKVWPKLLTGHVTFKKPNAVPGTGTLPAPEPLEITQRPQG